MSENLDSSGHKTSLRLLHTLPITFKVRVGDLIWGWLLVPIVLAVLVFLLAYPIALLFINSFVTSQPGQALEWGTEGWILAFTDRNLLPAIANTFGLAAVRIVLSTAIAIFFAWVVARTETPFRGFIEVVLWLGFFLPLLPVTMGWVLLLDPHVGLINNFLMNVFRLSEAPFNIFSYWGIVWCHLAFSTSIRFLLITPAFRNMDAALEEAALTSGSSGFGTLLRITVPILAPALLGSTLLGFIKSLESFEIELILGLQAGIYVLPTKIYDFIRFDTPLYGPATALSSIFLMVIFVLFWMYHIAVRNRDFTTISGRGYSSRPAALGKWRWLTFSICMLFISLMIFLPLITLIIGTFMNVFGHFNLERVWTTQHWIRVFGDPIFSRSLWTTLVLAIGASVVGTLFYAVISYVTVRTHFPGRKAVDFLCWLPWTVPGVLLGLALLWTVLGSGSVTRFIYGTTYLLIIAMIIKETPVGTQIVKAAILQISKELEEASTAAGASRFWTFVRILLPLLSPTLVAVGLIVFIATLRDISTLVFLARHDARTLSLLMFDYLVEGNIEMATVLAVFIVFVILCLVFLVRILGLGRIKLGY